MTAAALRPSDRASQPVLASFGAPPVEGPVEGMAALDRIGTVVTLDRDSSLFYEGDAADYYFRVIKGAVRSSKMLADGRRHIGAFFLAGDFIGLDADAIYPFVAEAMTSVTVMRYSRRKIDVLISEQPRVATYLVGIMRDGLCSARQRMTALGHMTAMERVASFLLELANRADDVRISLPMTRTDIGDYLGLTMETVSRAFSQLKNEGIIKQQNVHELAIVDRAALENLGEAA